MKNEITLVFEPEKMLEKAEIAGKAALTKPAVDALKQILKWQLDIENALAKIKEAVPMYAEEFMPGFLGIVDPTKELSVIYRVYGSKYVLEDQQLAQGFLKENVRYEVDADKVEQYFADHNELPEGIKERERAKKLSIELKKNNEKTARAQIA